MVKSYKIKPVTKRMMLTLSHYKFRNRLIYKSNQRGCSVMITTEEFTSKTCTSCGTINDVAGKKTYSCSACNLKIDRDINGARNILLRTLTNRQ